MSNCTCPPSSDGRWLYNLIKTMEHLLAVMPCGRNVTRIEVESMTINDLRYAVVRLCRKTSEAPTSGRLMRPWFSCVTWETDTRKCSSTSNWFKAVADKLTDLGFVWTCELVGGGVGEASRELLKQPDLWKPAGRLRQFYLPAWLLLITHLTRCRVEQPTSVSRAWWTRQADQRTKDQGLIHDWCKR